MFGKFFWKIIDFFEIFILIFIVLGLPLIFSREVYLMYELPKILLFRIFVILLLFVHGMKSLHTPILGFQKLFLELKTLYLSGWIKFFVVLALFFLVLSTITSPNFLTAFWGNYDKRFGLFTILHFLVFGITTLSILRSNWQKFLSAFQIFVVVPLVVNAIVSFFQLFLGGLDLSLTEGRAVGTFGQANFLAGYSIMLLPFLVFFFYRTKRILPKIYQCIGIICAVVVIWFSGSRIGIALLICLFIVFGFFVLMNALADGVKSKGMILGKRLKVFLFFIFSLLLIISLGLFILFFPRFNRFGLVDETRVLIWKSSIDLIEERPLLGYGLDVSGYVFPTKMYENGVSHALALDRAHSEILELAVNGGIPFAIIIILLNFVLLYSLSKKLRVSERSLEKYMIFVLMVSFMVFWVRSSVDVNGINQYILYVFVCVAIMHKIIQNRVKKVVVLPKEAGYNYVVVLIYIIISVLGVTVSLTELIADKYYHDFQHSNSLDKIQKSVDFAPYEVRYRMEFLDAKVRAQNKFKLSEVMSQIIIDQQEYSAEYYYRIGKYYEYMDNDLLAHENYRKAVKKAPVRRIYVEAFNE